MFTPCHSEEVWTRYISTAVINLNEFGAIFLNRIANIGRVFLSEVGRVQYEWSIRYIFNSVKRSTTSPRML